MNPTSISTPAIHSVRSAGASGTDTVVVLAETPAHAALGEQTSGLPLIVWLGALDTGVDADEFAVDAVATIGTDRREISSRSVAGRAVAVLPQMSERWLGRPALAGFRIGSAEGGADGGVGTDWSTAFHSATVQASTGALSVEAIDDAAGLSLRTDIEAVAGGALRMRHTLTNRGEGAYVVESLDVVVPVSDVVGEILDMTGRWAFERAPQRRPIGDGVWLRENRAGRPNFDSPTMLIAGRPGFGFGSGEVWGIHLAWSGNARHFVERQPSGVVTMGAGELLLAGEMVLEQGDSYATPWLHVGASTAGLDELAAQAHGYLRSLPTHPRLPSPVVSNVWEAVYFDHDLDRLRHLADLAASIGVERFVLDDGWFGARRHDRAGLGDWAVSPEVWPEGLTPLADHVTDLGMQFGLWFEPEMVNPDSVLYRAHPDWILNTPGHEPALARHQLVLDIGRPEVREHVFEQVHAVLDAYPVSFVKWDHNRLLVDAGSGGRAGGAGVHRQTLGFYALLDRLRAAHPQVEWETCASGGGRIDLEVLARTQRAWTSDMTDALARQMIQRWTGQLVAPEYLGAHVSAATNHQTGRHFTLDFRAATAFFADFGVEWDVSAATEAERDRLAQWIAAYKRHRGLLHSGRVVRVDTGVEGIWVHGVVAADGSEAVFAYVQLDEVVRDPPAMRCTGLDPARRYTASLVVAGDEQSSSASLPGEALPGRAEAETRGDYVSASSPGAALPGRAEAETRGEGWRGSAMTLSGAVLGRLGLPAPARRPLSVTVVHLIGQ